MIQEVTYKARLLSDVFSHFKKDKKYGSRFDIVTIISENHDVLIVEDKKSERFPVNKTKVQAI